MEKVLKIKVSKTKIFISLLIIQPILNRLLNQNLHKIHAKLAQKLLSSKFPPKGKTLIDKLRIKFKYKVHHILWLSTGSKSHVPLLKVLSESTLQSFSNLILPELKNI